MKIPVYVESITANPRFQNDLSLDPAESEWAVKFLVQPYWDFREKANVGGHPFVTQTQTLIIAYHAEPPFRAGQQVELTIGELGPATEETRDEE